MEHSHVVAEKKSQALGNLCGQRNFGKHVEHAFPVAYGFGYEMYVDFCLAARCYSVQQAHVFGAERGVYPAYGLLLRRR